MRLNLCLCAVLLGLLGACSPQSSGGAAPAVILTNHPVSGLKVIPLTVTTASKRHVFKVEVAASEAEQQKGLMFRTSMAGGEGMIFPMNPPRTAAFWMRNTVIPLDIIYIGTDRRILNIAANAVPYDERPLASAGEAAGVLELNGGRAAQLGIGPGDRVEW
jgi:uncharacterized protein